MEVLVATVMLTSLIQLGSTAGLRFSQSLKDDREVDRFLMEHRLLNRLFREIPAAAARTSLLCAGHPYTRFQNGGCVDDDAILPPGFPSAEDTQEARSQLAIEIWQWVAQSDETQLSEPFYTNTIQPLLRDASCIRCHANFDNYNGILAVANQAMSLSPLGQRFIPHSLTLDGFTEGTGIRRHLVSIRRLVQNEAGAAEDDPGDEPLVIQQRIVNNQTTFCPYTCPAGQGGVPNSCETILQDCPPAPAGGGAKGVPPPPAPPCNFQHTFQCQQLPMSGGADQVVVRNVVGAAACACLPDEFLGGCAGQCVQPIAPGCGCSGCWPAGCGQFLFDFTCTRVEEGVGNPPAPNEPIQYQINSWQVNPLNAARPREQRTAGVLITP